jgi:hypothetical protein
MPKRWIALAFVALFLISACGQDPEEEEEVKPIDITPGVAIAEPAAPTNPAVDPAIAYDGTRVHMVYSHNDGALYDLMYAQRVGGGTYSAPAAIFPASTGHSRNAHVFLDSADTLHIVWEQGTTPNREIYYATRTSGGIISTAANMTNTSEDEANPRVHVDGTGRIHIVWEGSTTPPNPTTAIFYRRTQGSIFLAATILPKLNGNQPAEMPDLCTDVGNRIYVVWAENNGSSRNIRLVRSDDNGQNFGSVGSGLAEAGTVDMTQPRVQGGLDGEVFLVFIAQDSSGDRALYSKFTRTGGTFDGRVRLLSSETGGLRDPELAAFRQDDDNYTVMVACNDGPAGGGNILVMSSPDNALNWPGDPVNLSQGNSQPATNVSPVLALDDNELIVSWAGQPAGGGVVTTWTSNSNYELPD